ncbi:mannan-binding lectin serine protease 1-like [Stigmatopora nigra]
MATTEHVALALEMCQMNDGQVTSARVVMPSWHSSASRGGAQRRFLNGRRNMRSARLLLLLLRLLPSLGPAPVATETATETTRLTGVFGSFVSPRFPAPYPDETRRRWELAVPVGFRVGLYFSHFHLESCDGCQCDHVKVEAGDGSKDGSGGVALLGLFCGGGGREAESESAPGAEALLSPADTLSVTFSSDFSNPEDFGGFVAHYHAVDVDECADGDEEEDAACDHLCHNYVGGFYCSCRRGYLLHADNRTCKAECGGRTFSQREGWLSSPHFPRPYPKSSHCSYLIRVAEGLRLRLRFDPAFDVEDHPEAACPYDYVKIETASGELGPFCGRGSPGLVSVDANAVVVVFHSDHWGNGNTGWRLTYTSEGHPPAAPDLRSGERRVGTPGPLSFPEASHAAAVDCGAPSAVDGARATFAGRDNSTRLGAVVRYVCDDARRQTGPEDGEYRCGPDGLWVHLTAGTRLPSCEPACGRPSQPLAARGKRVVGGRAAQAGNFPWQVLLSVEDSGRVPPERRFGSGALLSDAWVLSAAHVLSARRRGAVAVPVDPRHVKVLAGALDRRTEGGLSAARVLLHPNFRPADFDNDIALVRLAVKVELGAAVRPICLPSPQGDDPAAPPDTLGAVAGWGAAGPEGAPDLLRFARLPVVAQDECRGSYAAGGYNVTDNMFCAGFRQGGSDTCPGDSGGAFAVADPATGRWAALGLVSWAGPEECGARRVYGVYTRVDRYLDWIRRCQKAD